MSDEHPHHGLGFRPTEYLEIPEAPESVNARLREGLASSENELDLRWAGEHVMFSLVERRRKIWSPWLSVALRDRTSAEGVTTTVVAQFCPHPQLWTVVMLSNIALASIFVLAAGFGWAQVALDRPAWALWVALGAGLAVLGSWLGSHVARHLAREQMHELWSLLTVALNRDQPES